jgi:hypothetical protein
LYAFRISWILSSSLLNRGLSYHFPEEGGKVRSTDSEKCGVDGTGVLIYDAFTYKKET